jgi:uncharacterized protein (TIGR00255 family)
MVLSMTGYGTGTVQKDETSVTVEIRTVNHRFLDLHVRMSREFGSLEPEIQQLIRGTLVRGRVDVTIGIQSGSAVEVNVNAGAVGSYLDAAARLREQFQFQDSLDLKTLLNLPGVLQSKDAGSTPDRPEDDIPAMVKRAVRDALDGVVRMRKQEGEALKNDMLRHLASISQKAKGISELAPLTVTEYRRKLEERLAQLLPQSGIDPQRVAQEVALLADKSDISEELARLASHLEQYESLIASGTEVGKKLDFLLQEMQRETNTILSKATNLEITRQGIAVKADIEKLREQVQNVE